MANRTFQEKLLSMNHGLVFLEGNCVIDSGQTSKVRSLKGSGIKAITWMATGTYKIQLDDAYSRYLGGHSGFVAGVTGNTNVAASGNPLTIGHVYIIRTVGTTTAAEWITLGVPSGVTAAAGVPFVALTQGTGTGSGTVFTPAYSGAYSVEVVGDPNLTINNTSDPHFYIQVLGPLVPGATLPDATPAATDPLNGSVLGVTMWLRNSSVVGKGE